MSTSVTVGVITYRRVDQLQSLLDGLEALDIGANDVSVLVVDNDPEGSAVDAVQARDPGPFQDLRVVHEPTPGIAAARNRAWAETRTPWLAFIDDDEVPEPDWLLQLLDVQARSGASVVTGPVIAVADDLPPWYCDRDSHPDGAPVRIATTGNMLVRTDLSKELEPGPFDVAFGLTGGSDRVLSMDLRHRGHEIVWAARARVHETVPPERLEPRWIRRRFLRYGTVVVRTDGRHTSRSRSRAARRAVRGVEGIARSVRALLVLGIVGRESQQRGRALQQLGYGTGLVVGALGFSAVEYRRDGRLLQRRRERV